MAKYIPKHHIFNAVRFTNEAEISQLKWVKEAIEDKSIIIVHGNSFDKEGNPPGKSVKARVNPLLDDSSVNYGDYILMDVKGRLSVSPQEYFEDNFSYIGI